MLFQMICYVLFFYVLLFPTRTCKWLIPTPAKTQKKLAKTQDRKNLAQKKIMQILAKNSRKRSQLNILAKKPRYFSLSGTHFDTLMRLKLDFSDILLLKPNKNKIFLEKCHGYWEQTECFLAKNSMIPRKNSMQRSQVTLCDSIKLGKK